MVDTSHNVWPDSACETYDAARITNCGAVLPRLPPGTSLRATRLPLSRWWGPIKSLGGVIHQPCPGKPSRPGPAQRLFFPRFFLRSAYVSLFMVCGWRSQSSSRKRNKFSLSNSMIPCRYISFLFIKKVPVVTLMWHLTASKLVGISVRRTLQ